MSKGKRIIVCGKCKKVGHNKRTCGKTLHKKQSPHPPKPLNVPPAKVKGKVFTTQTQQPSHTATPKVVNSSNVAAATIISQPGNQYNLEHFETLWELVSGKYGERTTTSTLFPTSDWKVEDTKLLVEMVCAEASNPHSLITAAQWKTFLTKFSTNVSLMFIASFDTAAHTWGYRPGRTMPPKIVEAFTLEDNAFLHARLMEVPHIPEEYIHKVLNNNPHSFFVLKSIVKNRTVSGKVLEKVENHLDHFNTGSEQDQAGVRGVRKGIAKHPNITKRIENKYINIYGTDLSHYNRVYANCLSNPNFTTHNIEEPFHRLMETVKSSIPHDYTPNGEGGTGVPLSPAARYLQNLADNPQLPPELFTQYLTPTVYSAEFYGVSPKHYANPKIDSTTCAKFTEALLGIGNVTKLKSLLNNPNADERTFTLVVNTLEGKTLSSSKRIIYNNAYNKLHHHHVSEPLT